MKRSIFLDRDGVLIRIKKQNNKPYSVDNFDKVSIIYETKKTLKKLKKDFLLIMVTNQPNVSRGLISRSEVIKTNNFIKKKFDLDDIYCCFHDDKHNCECRKPKAGMLIKAKKKWGINLKKSILVGDRKKDIDAGKKVGCKNFFIDYNYDETKPSKNNCTYIKSFKEIEKYI
tara:strand:+ start:1398 stop:1913 length:516 start_codon:yes stop_codon:yes gene_type:complete